MNPTPEAPTALLGSLLRSIPGAVYRCRNDRDMTPEFFSEGVYGLTGYSPEDFVSGRIRRGDLVVTEDRARILAETQAALAARLPFTLEYRLRTADGGEKWVREHSHGVFAPDGTMQALDGFIEDITEHRRDDQALRRQTERMRIGQATARMIVMDWDASTDTIDWSDSPEWLRGPLPPSGKYPLYKDQVHPDDRARWLAARKDWIDNLKGEEIDYRVVRTDGVVLWVHSRRTAFAGLDGKAVRILVALHDITERVIAEQRARAADERLRLAIEHLGESIAVMDAEDRIVVANRYFRELNGNTHLVEPGRLYEEHLRAGMAVGNYPEAIGREEAWLSARLARHRAGGTVEVRRQDGKWLQVTDQRLPDGGMVSFALDITARKEVEFALIESESRFRDFARASADWYFETDARGRFTWVSETIEPVSGNKVSDIIGRDRIDMISEGADLRREPWASHLAALARHEPFRDLRYPRRRPNGLRWVSSSGVPRFGGNGEFLGYRTVGSDVTERVEAEQRARMAELRLHAAIENLGELIMLTDAEDRVVFANRLFLEFNARIAEHIVPGRHYVEIMRAGIALGLFPQSAGCEDAWLAERMAQRRSPTGPVERRREDGRWLRVEDQRLPDGGIITFGVEITESKRIEEELRNVNADLERRVAARTAELESFSYSVSHDLRAPLRAVTGFAKILLQEEAAKLSAEGRRYLGIIDANGRRMGQLIDSLLALGRFSGAALNKTEVNMARLAREACDELAASWPAAQITVGPLPRASGNPMLLKQVFLNLVGNGLKYSANAAAPHIGIRAEENRYIVSDNGAGFDMAYVGKLFQPFERLHTVQEFEGTGIGLAIVKRIVERHGGRVEAHGVPGEGATFSFTLGHDGGV